MGQSGDKLPGWRKQSGSGVPKLECFLHLIAIVSCIHLVNSPYKDFGKGRQNCFTLHSSRPMKFLSTIVAYNRRVTPATISSWESTNKSIRCQSLSLFYVNAPLVKTAASATSLLTSLATARSIVSSCFCCFHLELRAYLFG